MYFLLGIALTFAFLLIVNLLVATVSSLVWKYLSPIVGDRSVNARAQIIFSLRVLPVVASLIFVFVFVVPAYLLHEPAKSGETVSLKLASIAILSSLGIGIALFRVIETWVVTRRLSKNWQSNATLLMVDEIDVPVYKIEHQFPVIAVIGIFRPKLFVASQVLESLETDEFRAAIAHEYGHLQAYDNFKRMLLRVCRDLLVLPLGKNLDRAWAENAESVADEFAAKKGKYTAINLASALVKIARIVPLGAQPAMPAGAYLLEEQNIDITSRVRRLLRFSDSGRESRQISLFGLSPSSVVWILAIAVIAILPLVDQNLLLSTHNTIEHFVHLIR